MYIAHVPINNVKISFYCNTYTHIFAKKENFRKKSKF